MFGFVLDFTKERKGHHAARQARTQQDSRLWLEVGALEKLHLDEYRLTNQGCTLLVSTLDSGAMPKLAEIRVVPNLHASSAATVAVALALERREG